MNRSEQINELGAALANAQSSMQNASKDKANPFFKAKYADLASVWEACRAPLSANGLSIVQLPRFVDSVVTVETILLHSSGQWIGTELSAPVKEQTAQAVGSAVTYLRRYSLASMAGVAPDDDDDGNGATGRQTQQHKPAQEQHQHATTKAPTEPVKEDPSHALALVLKAKILKATGAGELATLENDIAQEHKARKINDAQRKRLADIVQERLKALEMMQGTAA